MQSSSLEVPSVSTTNYLMRPFKAAAAFLQGIQSAAVSLINWPVDLYKLSRYEEGFMFSKLYERARDDTNITKVTMPIPPQVAQWSEDKVPANIYVITGPTENVRQVAEYGEKNNDPKARFYFNFFNRLMGRKNIIHTLLNTDDAKQEKKFIKMHLVQPEALEFGVVTARKRIRLLLNDWNKDLPYQDQISYIGSNVVGVCVFGIPELPLSYIPKLREVGESFPEYYKNPDLIRHGEKFLDDLNKDLIPQHIDAILAANKFGKKDFDLHADPALDKTQEMLKRKLASWYAAEGSLSSILMVAIAHLNQIPEIKEKLKAEVEDFKKTHNITQNEEITLENLRQDFPYLDCLYRETLRFASTQTAIARKTSVASTFNLFDKGGVKHSQTIPAESILFFPVRARHFDATFWDKPQEFQPARFDYRLPRNIDQTDGEYQAAFKLHQAQVKKNRDQLIPFSVGIRSCPSQYGFSELVFKTVILECLDYKFTFNNKIEDVPVCVPQSSWKKTYFATVEREEKKLENVCFPKR